MSPVRDRCPDCVLEEGLPCPPECRRAGRCVVLRIRQRNAVDRTGVPLAVVGETLRFRQVLPKAAMLLLPLSGLEARSAELAVEVAHACSGGSETRAVPGDATRAARRGDR